MITSSERASPLSHEYTCYTRYVVGGWSGSASRTRTLAAAECLTFALQKVTDMKLQRLSPSAHCTVDVLQRILHGSASFSALTRVVCRFHNAFATLPKTLWPTLKTWHRWRNSNVIIFDDSSIVPGDSYTPAPTGALNLEFYEFSWAQLSSIPTSHFTESPAPDVCVPIWFSYFYLEWKHVFTHFWDYFRLSV